MSKSCSLVRVLWLFVGAFGVFLIAGGISTPVWPATVLGLVIVLLTIFSDVYEWGPLIPSTILGMVLSSCFSIGPTNSHADEHGIPLVGAVVGASCGYFLEFGMVNGFEPAAGFAAGGLSGSARVR